MKRSFLRAAAAALTLAFVCLLGILPVFATYGESVVVELDDESGADALAEDFTVWAKADVAAAARTGSSVSSSQGNAAGLRGVDWMSAAIVGLTVLLVVTFVLISIRESIRQWRESHR